MRLIIGILQLAFFIPSYLGWHLLMSIIKPFYWVKAYSKGISIYYGISPDCSIETIKQKIKQKIESV